jgi:hypothetical protein
MELHEDLIVHGTLRVVTPTGELVFGGNELEVRATNGDAAKVRIDGPQGGAVSFNVNGVEMSLVIGGGADDRKGGGEVALYAMRRGGSTTDADMVRVGVWSPAYTADGRPVSRQHGCAGCGLEPF